jgi:hypothetical protein
MFHIVNIPETLWDEKDLRAPFIGKWMTLGKTFPTDQMPSVEIAGSGKQQQQIGCEFALP